MNPHATLGRDRILATHHLPVPELFNLISRGGAVWDEQLRGLNPAASYTVVCEKKITSP